MIGSRSFASFKYTDYAFETAGRPDTLLDFPIRVDGSVRLDVANLDRQGAFRVPTAGSHAPRSQQLINRYGYLENGVRTGGGLVGVRDHHRGERLLPRERAGRYDFMLETAS